MSIHLLRPMLALAASTAVIVWATTGRGETRDASTSPRLVIAVVDGDGAPLDARVRVESLGALARIGGGPAGHHRQVLAVRGRAELALAAGRYHVVASHGPEFTIDEREVTIEEHDATSIALAVERFVDPGAYRAADFHVHTDASDDGRVPLRTRLASARAEGLAVIALTDHNRVTRPSRATDDGLFVLPSVEVTTWNPEVGHFNVFPAERAIPHVHRTPDAIFDEVHRERRLVQVNHPRLDDHIAYFELAGLHGAETEREGFGLDFDMLELWNGYDLGRPDTLAENFREWLGLIEAGHPITATGNSDSHRLDRTWVGYPRTYVELDGDEPTTENVMRALGEGRSFVTTGPLLDVRLDGAHPGGTVRSRAHQKLRLAVRVMAAPYVAVDRIEIWLDATRVRTIRIPPSTGPIRYDRTIAIDAGQARNLVVSIRGEAPMDLLLPGRDTLPMAFTNPIHLVHTPRESESSRVAQQ